MKRRSMKKSMKKGMKKAMKKSMKKSMKRRAMKKKAVSKRAAVNRVWRGKGTKTKGGLTRSKLTKNKHGRIVSKKKQASGKKSAWIAAVLKARKALGVKGFAVVGGKTKGGQALLKKARSLYKK